MIPPLDDYAGLMGFIDTWEKGQADFLGALLYDTLKPFRVIDWGCASGLYLLPFKPYATVLGIDAEPTAGKLLNVGEWWWHDIRLPFTIPISDLALCIEVAEHLQPEYADQLVANVANSADVVFWSAARPGQGGQNHYNEQPKEYWFDKFAAHGFGLHPDNDLLMAEIAADPECQKVQWLIPNAMLLQRIK